MTRPKYDTSMGGADRNFPATEWTRLLDPSQKEAILAELCTKYWKPLYSYLRASGFGNDKAKDLVQGFLAEKVIDQELIRQADKTRGKLRTFLLTAIRNYAINLKRSEKTSPGLDKSDGNVTAFDDPETAYDKAWADQLLQDVLGQLQVECRKRGKTVHWRLFQEWLLELHTDGQRPQMKNLAEKYGIGDPAQAYHMIENIKRRFRSILREELRMLVDSDGEVDTEIGNFISVFQRGAAR